MKTDPLKHWNSSHSNLTKRTLPSNYAIDKEKLFPKNSIVCDLGGGIGVDSIYFIEKGHKVYLYDISNSALKIAGENAKLKGLKDKLTEKQVDLTTENIPSDDNFFDVVYSRLSLHYFFKNRTVEILKDIYRVLKPGGSAYIAVKSPEDKDEMNWLEKNNEKLENGIWKEGVIIKTRFSKQEYEQMLNNAGIKNYEVHDYTEKFGDQKVFVKSKADKLLYVEIIIMK